MGLITKSDCMSVTDLNQTVSDIWHVVDVCTKLHKDFHDFCFFNLFDQLVGGIVFNCLWLKKLQKQFCVTARPLRITFVSKCHKTNKKGLDEQQQSLQNCKKPQQICKYWQINCVFRLSLCVSTQIMEFEYKQAYKMIETGVLVWKSKNKKPYQPFFFTFLAICLKLNDKMMCFTASPNFNAK